MLFFLDDISALPAVLPSRWGGRRGGEEKRAADLPYRVSLSIMVLSCLNRVKITEIYV